MVHTDDNRDSIHIGTGMIGTRERETERETEKERECEAEEGGIPLS